MSLEVQVTIEDKTMVYNQLIWKFYINYLINHTTNYSVMLENAFLRSSQADTSLRGGVIAINQTRS